MRVTGSVKISILILRNKQTCKKQPQSYSCMTLIYISLIIWSADKSETILPSHRSLYQRSDLAEMNELFDPKRQHIL